MRVSPLVLSLLATVTVSAPTIAQTGLPAFSGSNNAPTVPAQQINNQDYHLGTGDRIQIDFTGVEEYSGEARVLVDGSVNLPLVGKVSVGGMNLDGASRAIAAAYSYYVRRPYVTVSLLQPRPLRLGVSGEVNRPGSYTISMEESASFPTVTDAIEKAEGITQAAELRQVRIRRPQPGNRPAQIITVDLWSVIQGNDLSQDIPLRDGDTIVIPTATSVNLAQMPRMADASFAGDRTQPLNIVVVGEVTRPGSHTIEPTGESERPRLTASLEEAGGITPSADIRNIRVRRSTNSGQYQTISVNLWQLLRQGDRTQDLILQEGDTIVIPTARNIDTTEAHYLAAASFAADRTQSVNVAVVGEVARPGPHIVQGETDSDSRLPTVTRAIQVAGGITQMADIRSVKVRRTTREGTRKTIDVNLWELLQQGDLEQDLILQQGDTVEIPTATAIDPDEAPTLASASFSPDSIGVNIVGEVEQPGTIEVPPNTPLNQAILAAGGFNNRARKSSVELIRLQPNGTVERRDIDVELGSGISEEDNPTLRENDVVVVGRSGLTKITDTVGSVLRPVGQAFSVLNFFRLFD
jgi:polysaccharide export outer membrane protein